MKTDGATRLFKRLLHSEQITLGVLAVLVGFLGGGGAVAFREAVDFAQLGFFGFRGEYFHSLIQSTPWWLILLAPALGGLIVALITRYGVYCHGPRGVAHVVEAGALRGGRISLREGIAAFAISAVTLGSGASAGREGPVVHFAAALSAKVSRSLHFGRGQARTLLACGVAAGVAASFNAPIAGVFFAIEVVTGNYALSAFAPVVIASVTGTVVTRAWYGHFPAFVIPGHEIVSFWEMPAFALLGVFSALVAMAVIWATDTVVNSHDRLRIPRFCRPILAGLAVGSIGLLFPQVMGVGYETTDQALKEELSLTLLIILIFCKTAATAITLGSGFGGGIFSPSLFLGAMLGGAFGIVATEIFPHLSSGHGAYTLVGMGAVAGATLGAPISTILIVFELTGDYQLTIAVMIATVIASQITQQTLGYSFISWQLQRRGVNLKGGRERRILRTHHIADLMKQDFVTAAPDASLEHVRRKLLQTTYAEIFVVDGDGMLLGTVTLLDMAEHAFDHSQDATLTAQDICRRHPPVARCDDDLEDAIWLIEECAEEHVAVVESDENMRLVGVLHEHDVMSAYHRAILETRREERL